MLIKRAATRQRYGGVAGRTLERWEAAGDLIRQAATTEAEAALGFPKSVFINGRRFDDPEKLDVWDRACAAAGRNSRTPPKAGRGTGQIDARLQLALLVERAAQAVDF
jgi:hypothetical protein